VRRGAVGRVGGVALLGAAALVGVGCTTSPDQLSAMIVAFLDSLSSAGPLGWLGFVMLYGAITLTGLPASSMQLTAGFLLGPGWGFAVTFVLTNAWGFLGFVLARTALRERVRRLVERSPALSALDAAVRDQGAWMVLLLRVSPLSPYNIVTLALGTTSVRPRDYLIGSMIGALLPMAFYVGIGASVSDLAAVWAGEVPTPGWSRLVGLIVTVAATAAVTWRVRRQLVAAGVA